MLKILRLIIFLKKLITCQGTLNLRPVNSKELLVIYHKTRKAPLLLL